MIKVAIVDDISTDRATLRDFVSQYFGETMPRVDIKEYSGGEELLDDYSPDSFSLVFLDIYMDGLTGLETARGLKAVDPSVAIIFTTSSKEHGAEAFDVEAFHYLVKPITRQKLASVLNKWYEGFCKVRTVTLKTGRTTSEVFISDIVYAEVQGRSCTVYTKTEKIATSLSLSALEGLLPDGEFIRPIRYCLVALRHIMGVNEEEVTLRNGVKLPVSRREKDNIRHQLGAYRLKKLRGR